MLNKNAPPVLSSHIINRNRLFALIDDAKKANAIWISAPGGSGKTSLVASYLKHRQLPFIWYQMDSSDNDVSTFFYYMSISCANSLGSQEKAFALLTHEYTMGMETYGIRFFEAIYHQLDQPTWIVLDNFQEIENDSKLYAIFAQVIEQVPDSVTIVFISRTDPHVRLSRLLVNRLLWHIDGKCLAMTLDECRALADTLNCRWSAKEIEHVHGITKGWAAGIILFSFIKITDFAAGPAGQVTPQNISDYFYSEIIEKCESRTRQFLLKTSYLKYLTPEAAANLTEMNAEKMITDIAQRNFFLERRQSSITCYQLHPMFQAFLQNHISKEMNTEEIQVIKNRTAEILLKEGEIDGAVNLYAQVHKFELIFEIVMSNALMMTAQGRTRTLLKWMEHLPLEYMDHHPWIPFWKGVSMLNIQPMEGQKLLKIALDKFTVTEDLFGQIISWSVLVETYLIVRATFQDLDELITQGICLEKMLPETLDYDTRGRLYGALLLALSLREPDHPDIDRIQETCGHLIGQCSDQQVLSTLGSYLCLSHVWIGQMNKAGFLMKQLAPILKRPDIAFTTRLNLQVTLSIYYVMIGDKPRARKNIDRVATLSRERGIHIYDFVIFAYGCYLGIFTGNIHLAQLYQKKMEKFLTPYSIWDTGLYNYISAIIALMENALAEARFFIDKSIELSLHCGAQYSIGTAYLLDSIYQLRQKNPESAGRVLDQIRKDGLLSKSNFILFNYKLLRAEAALQMNLKDETIRHLDSAFKILKNHGIMIPVGIQRQVLSILLGTALEAKIEIEIVTRLIDRLKLDPPESKDIWPVWPWHNRICALGRVEIFHKDEPPPLSKKTPIKILEFLQVLISSQQGRISKTLAAEWLWPDADGDRALQSLDTTLHRVRKLLQNKNAIRLEKGYLTLNRSLVWVDAWQFETLLDMAGSLEHDKEQIDLLVKAVDLYQGHFDSYQSANPVTYGYSQRLKTLWIGAVIKLLEHISRTDQPEKALQMLEKELVKDNTVEELLRERSRILSRIRCRN